MLDNGSEHHLHFEMRFRCRNLRYVGSYVIATVFLLQNMDIVLSSPLNKDERSLADSNDIEEVFNPSNQLQRSFDEYPVSKEFLKLKF